MAEKGFKRKLTAILSADVEGYSRLMGDNEEATVRTLTAYREVLATLIQQHNGNVLDSPGDNLLAEFVSVVDAVQCAVAVQKEIKARNDELTENRKMQFRIGINLGDVIQEEERIYGDGVNIAARLEGLAEPGGICISKTAFDHIESKLPYGYDFIGDQTVKNITKPVGAYRVLMEPRVTVSGKPIYEKSTGKRRMPIIIGIAALVVLAVFVGLWQFYARPPTSEPASMAKMTFELPDMPSIAVMPFTNMSDDPTQDYFSDGITENIIMALSNTPKLFVISRNSTFAYKEKSFNVKNAAEELGVRYILEGSVLKTNNHVRITAQLIDALTGGHLWAERYDRELIDILALHDEITLEIITAMQVKLTEGEQIRIHRGGTTSLEAFIKVLKGREHHFKYTNKDLEIAEQLYEEAIALDPTYTTAYFWLGMLIDAKLGMGQSISLETDISRLHELADRIFALDEANSSAHLLMSRMYDHIGQFDKSAAEAKKAVAIDPNNADGYAVLGLTLSNAKRYQEAIEWLKKAIRRNPIPPSWYYYELCENYLTVGQPIEALAIAQKLVKYYADHPGAHLFMGLSYMVMGNHAELRTTCNQIVDKGLASPAFLAICAYDYSMTGEYDKAIAVLKEGIDPGYPSSQARQRMLLSHLAENYRKSGQYQKAIETGRILLNSRPNKKHALRAYITMICAYSALGREKDVNDAVQEVLQISPDFSIETQAKKDSFAGISFWDYFLKSTSDKDMADNALRKVRKK